VSLFLDLLPNSSDCFADAVLRSSLYGHFSESLSGLATIRAYDEVGRFQEENRKRMDIENRAYWLTVTNQRWLGIRLDFLGTILTFCVAILAVAARFTLSPSQIGVALSYILLVQQVRFMLISEMKCSCDNFHRALAGWSVKAQKLKTI
jgi:ABC-type multidrug transport system fused ATPase/permease subunit